MITYQHYRNGALYGIRYWIPQGERIPMHAHTRELAHNVIVESGRVLVLFETEEMPITGSRGSVIDFDSGQRHEVVAQEAAIILNLFVNGAPPGYLALPPEELSGVIP